MWTGSQRSILLNYNYPSAGSKQVNFNWQPDTRYDVEIYFKKHASAGFYKVYINDALVLSVTGLDTSGAYAIDRIQYGMIDLVENTLWTDASVILDNIMIMDTGPIGTLDTLRQVTFEAGDFSEVDGVQNSPIVTTAQAHNGLRSCQHTRDVYSEEGYYVNVGLHKELFIEMVVMFDVLPATGKYIEFLQVGRSGVDLFRARLYNDGGTKKWSFAYRHAGSLTWVNSGTSTNPSADTFYNIIVQLRCSHVDGQTVGIYKMKVDDTELADISQTSKDTDYVAVSQVRVYLYADGIATSIWTDCLTVQTTAITMHTGSGESYPPGGSAPVISEPAEVVPIGLGWLQVFVNQTQVEVFDVSVSEAKGGLGNVTAPVTLPVERGDYIYVICEGEYLIAGKVTEITRDLDAGTKQLTVQTKTQRLNGVYVDAQAHQSYTGLDAGAIAKDLIDYYFNGLFTSVNVNVETGIIVPTINFADKTVLSAFDELANRCNGVYRVDKDGDVYFDVRGNTASGVTLNRVDLLSPLSIREVGEPVGTLIVKGDGVQGQAGSGLPQVQHIDKRVKSNAEATQLAEALLERYGVSTVVMCEVQGFVNARYGESIILNVPEEDYSNETVTVDSVRWSFTGGECKTSFQFGEAGEGDLDLEGALTKIVTAIQENDVAHISTHQGVEIVDTDPSLNYTDIVDAAASSETQVQTSAVTLQSQAAGTEADAVEQAYVKVVVARGASLGKGFVKIMLMVGATEYHSWFIHVNADVTSYTLTALINHDFSGETVLVKAQGMDLSDQFSISVNITNLWTTPAGGDVDVTIEMVTNVYLTATLLVRQYAVHSHAVSQSELHDF